MTGAELIARLRGRGFGLMEEAADRIESLTADLARSTRIISKMVPLSEDGNHVFWDGVGEIELDHNGKLRTGIEEATKALLEIHRIVPLHPAGDIALATLKKLKEMDLG